ncbi:MAG: protein kinase [Planctomycetota bacterium]
MTDATTDAPPPSPSPPDSSSGVPATPRPGTSPQLPTPRSSRRLRLSANAINPHRPKPGEPGYDPLADDLGEPPVTVDSSDASVLTSQADGAIPGLAHNPTAATIPVLPATVVPQSPGTRTGLRAPVRKTPSQPDINEAPEPPVPATLVGRPDASGSGSDRHTVAGIAGASSTADDGSNIHGLEIALALASRTKFHIGRELGRGGTARVLAARDVSLRRDVALKYLARPEAGQARFIEEAQITAQLQHPNIVPVYELGVDKQKRAYMAMKRVHGRTLSQVIANAHAHADRNPSDWPRFLRRLLDSFLKVCDAIGYAHARKVIHRDLKPDNVMVGAFGEVLVMDWGLARPLTGESASHDDMLVPDAPPPPDVKSDRRFMLTLDGQIVGTLPYMPPEQAEGRHSELDTRADIYSLGAVLYQVLTNSAPFTGTDLQKLRDQVSEGRLLPPSRRAPAERVPRELEAVVLRAMAFDPADRYPTAGALRDDVERFMDGRALESVQYGRIELIAKWVQRNRVLAGGVAATILALVAGLVGILLVDSEARARDARAQADLQRGEAERLAESQRAQTAELNRAKADAAREAAERKTMEEAQKRREADLQSLMQQGEIDKLREMLGGEARSDQEAALREFKLIYDDLRRDGKDPSAIFAELGPDRVARFTSAFDRMLESGTRITPRDRAMGGFIYQYVARDLPRALEQFDLALQEDAGYIDAHFMRAAVYADMGRHRDAIADLDFVIAHAPGHVDALFNRGKARSRVGDDASALEDYTMVITLTPRNIGGYINRGAVLARLGRVKEAEDDFTEAIRVDERAVLAWHNRGKLRASHNDRAGAVDDFNHALSINPDLHECRLDRATTVMLGNPMSALRDLDYVLQRVPDHWRAHYVRALLRVTSGQRDGARADFEAAEKNAPEAERAGIEKMRHQLLGE